MGTVRLHPALLALAAFIVLVAASCRAPQENGVFVRCTEKDELGAYRFTVDLGDSLHSHALYFYTVIDARARKGGTGLIRLQIDFRDGRHRQWMLQVWQSFFQAV